MTQKDEHAQLPRHAMLVLGMHRSGTSVLTRFVAALGAALPADPNPAAPDNPEGYHEPAGLVMAHDALLRAADSAWFDTRPFDPDSVPPAALGELVARMEDALRGSYATAPFFVLKDPRICRFLPLTRAVLSRAGARASAILALRDPAEVAASLGRRDGISAAYAGILWARHLIDAERATRDMPRTVVCYAELLQDWRGSAARIAALAPGEARPPVEEEVLRILRPDLRHHAGLSAEAVFGPRLGAALDRLLAALRALADRDDTSHRAAVDEAAAPVLATAQRARDAVEAEFLLQRLTTPHPHIASPDPVRDRRRFAAAMERLHASAEASEAAS